MLKDQILLPLSDQTDLFEFLSRRLRVLAWTDDMLND